MIAEIVTFQNPEGASREALLEGARATIPRWQGNDQLLRKHYLCSLNRSRGMGFYLWSSIEAARAGHDAQWIAEAEARTGGKVHIEYHDLLMVLDNEARTVTAYGEPKGDTR